MQLKFVASFYIFVLFTLAVNSESMHPVHWDIYWEEFQILPPYHKLPCLEAAVRLFSQHPLSSHPTPASAIAKNAVTKRNGDETRKDWPNTLFSLFGNSKIRHALSHLPKLINEWINNYQTVWQAIVNKQLFQHREDKEPSSYALSKSRRGVTTASCAILG